MEANLKKVWVQGPKGGLRCNWRVIGPSGGKRKLELRKSRQGRFAAFRVLARWMDLLAGCRATNSLMGKGQPRLERDVRLCQVRRSFEYRRGTFDGVKALKYRWAKKIGREVRNGRARRALVREWKGK